MSMIKKMLLIIIFVLFCTNLYAQEETDLKGTMGFSFYFEDFDIKSFNKKLGGRYWISNNTAIRASVGFVKKTENLTDHLNNYEIDSSRTNIEFSLGLEKNFKLHKKVTPYLGAEITYTPSYTTRKRIPKEEPTVNVGIEDKIDSYNFKIAAPIGVEYWFSKSITIAAQHSFGVMFSKKEIKYRRTENNRMHVDQEISSSRIGFGTFYLILSTYF